MSVFGRIARAIGRAITPTARAIEVATGLALLALALFLAREIWQILAGTQPVSGASPWMVVALLLAAVVAAAFFGVRFIRQGF